MNRFRWLPACAALLCAVTAFAQLPLPPDLNLFGDDLPLKAPDGQGNIPIVAPPDKPKIAPEYAHLLVFQDGRQIHGQVAEITRDEIVRQRPDASAALRFPRTAVRRIFLASEAQPPELTRNFFLFNGGPPSEPATDQSGKPVPATLKLPGGDWLFGGVTSNDGQSFALSLEDGTSLAVPRTALEWLHFGVTPAPAFGLSGSPMDLDGWLPNTANLELAGGTTTVRGASWIGRAMMPPKRFEVALELPPGSEEGIRLWVQPFGPRVNAYSTGTVQIRLGKKEITRVIVTNKLDTVKSTLPPEAADEKGPVSYRFFYDGPGQRLVVLRNGRPIGDWNLAPKKEDAANLPRMMPQREINGVCFDRESRDAGNPLKFNRLRIQPWNGIVPAPEDAATTTDQLAEGTGNPVTGKLESIADKTLTFSGKSHDRQEGLDVRLANTPASLAAPEAKLELGRQGEFGVRALEMRAGKLHCESVFAPSLEIPAQALQAISFPPHLPGPREPADVLVFKNGDELQGRALSADSQGPLHWKTADGQELDIQPERIAGLRLAPAADAPNADTQDAEAKPSAPAATAELRTGECLRGKLVALDDQQVRIAQAPLGTLSLDRSRLWRLFPNPHADVIEGGRDPDVWLHAPAAQRRKAGGAAQWTYLDGTYILHGGDSSYGNMENMAALQREIDPSLERFEVRVEAAAPWAMATNVGLQLSSKAGPSLNVTVSYDYVQLVIYNARGNNRPNWRNVQLEEKLPEMDSRRAVRLFVDTAAGTCDLVVNGALIVRVGQNASERLPKSHYTIRVQPYPNEALPAILSHLWVGPWNGDLPRAGNTGEAATLLGNGDAAPGLPREMRDGRMILDSDLGALELPLERVQQLDFGGALQPEKAAAHIRLADGTVANVERFHWDGHELTAHSATFGDLHLPATAVSEIIYQPIAPHTPMSPTPKKVAQTTPPKDALPPRP